MKSRCIRMPAHKSLTLLELGVVVCIIVLAVIPTYTAFIQAINLTQDAKEMNMALDDAVNTLEKIKAMSFTGLFSVFANNTPISEAHIGNFSLPGESIRVVYINGTTADPLPIEVQVSWQNKNNRSQRISLRTMRTRSF